MWDGGIGFSEFSVFIIVIGLEEQPEQYFISSISI
jgi:hypothetical protein